MPSPFSRIPGDPFGKVNDAAFGVRKLGEAGILKPIRPDKLARMGWTAARWGITPATGVAVAAIHHPNETFLVDELGSLTFDEVHRRSNAIARGFAERGVGPGKGVGIMARNHRGFVEAALAAAKLGSSALFLNTMFSGRQLAEVMNREGPELLVFDEEFGELLEDVEPSVDRVLAWKEDGTGDPTLEDLVAAGDEGDLSPPAEDGRFVILTSGTTGTPKGAQRSSAGGLGAMAALFDKIPFHSRDRMMIACPLFHSWGFTHFALSMPLASTIILRRRFDPEAVLEMCEEQDAQVLVVVPVMLQRIMRLPDETLDRFEVPELRIVSVSGSALPGELAIAWMDRYGDNVHNLYGSTEVAYASIATPEDLRAAPGTAGRPPRGTVVRLYDENGKEVPTGEVGRIFVGNQLAFEGYTGGGNKEVIDGLMSSGDVGHFDSEGRLFIDGRDDEMIVSGGENVFPREVEDLLSDHEAIAEAAVIGVDDEEFGQRLKAFVVLADGKELSESDAKAFVKKNLAGYKTPRDIAFLDELPRNATGKVLKRELREHEAGSKP
jgi:acyl-CoA synthetase (AMP-forming)/AMP-acid ligase II